MSLSLFGHTNAMEEVPAIPVIIKAKGVALALVEEEIVPMPAHVVLRGLLFKPIKVGPLSIAQLAIKDGILEINEIRYNITRGKGALVLEKHNIMLVANGTGPSGENIILRLSGNWVKLPDETIFLMRMRGVVKFEDDSKLLLLLRAVASPRPLLK
jgi:hypothetical protein